MGSREVVVVSRREPVWHERLDVNKPELRRKLVYNALMAAGATFTEVLESDAEDIIKTVAVRLGVITEARADFLRNAWGLWRGAHAPEASFACAETEQQDGLVPNFFARSRPGPTASWARQLAYFATDTFTPVYADTYDQICDDCAVVAAAVRIAAESRGIAYALTTHPGHHASADQYGGFCFINHAVLAMRMLSEKLFSPAMLVDVDYHAGDGSADLLLGEKTHDVQGSPSEVFLSLHAPNDYPYVDGDGDARAWAVALNPGCSGDVYASLLDRELSLRKSKACKALVVSLGFDCLAGDPCAAPGHATALQPRDFAAIRSTLRRHFPDVPTVVVQEGGYALDDVPAAAVHFWRGEPPP